MHDELIAEAHEWLGHAENNGIDGGFNNSIDERDYDLIQRLTAALKEQQEAWRPIESAPKDGQTIITMEYYEADEHVPECWQYNLAFYYGNGSDGKWLNGEDGGYTEVSFTHWSPLPPPPIGDN